MKISGVIISMKELNKEYLEQCPVDELFECTGLCNIIGISPLLNDNDMNDLNNELKRVLCKYIIHGDLSKLVMYEDNFNGKHIIRKEYDI